MKKVVLILMLGILGMTLFAQTEFEVKFKDLPRGTQKYVKKNFDGWTVDKAMQGENAKGKMTSCEVFVSKGTEKLRLIFDKDGEFVKKEAVVQPAVPEAMPPAMPATPTDTTKK
jgi:hypothetical protein